ncbi:energy transducer TonB [Chryseobacterium limigenitum]|uniref:TonB protein C-terminal n=1 Tax=Chryseobacterium limigenitum TaxID=1612149 RepID=A0A1K2IR38_9FLAO|nr:hypothetical protein [Chryseobacterium limigenitum]SFZ94901.1 hypothetical protein SAMN05216324_10831 [Chryseobacterium limigenitum]
MKKLFFFLIALLSITVFGQKTDSPTITDYTFLKSKMKMDDVVTKADKAPEFPGGMEAFHRKFAENMDIIDVKTNKINTRVYFIVEKNGYIRYVTATGDDKKHSAAAETAIRRMFVKWKPATINNEPVRYLYTFPLSLKKY